MITLKLIANLLRWKPQISSLISSEFTKTLHYAPWADKNMWIVSRKLNWINTELIIHSSHKKKGHKINFNTRQPQHEINWITSKQLCQLYFAIDELHMYLQFLNGYRTMVPSDSIYKFILSAYQLRKTQRYCLFHIMQVTERQCRSISNTMSTQFTCLELLHTHPTPQASLIRQQK